MGLFEFGEKKPEEAKPIVPAVPAGDIDPRALQEAYWKFDAQELADLAGQGIEKLSWAKLLRLHHLACVQLFEKVQGRPGSDPVHDLHVENDPTVVAAAQRLALVESPYRPRHCFVWQGQAGDSATKAADLRGPFGNASYSHMGALEVIFLTAERKPRELGFVGLDEIRGMLVAKQGIFRPAKLFFDDGRPDEIVWLPLLYGISWRSVQVSDRDPSITRFCCNQKIDGKLDRHGLGVGHQDFAMDLPTGPLFGLGSVAELMVGLELSDPKFDAKCRSRGIDPLKVREQAGKSA